MSLFGSQQMDDGVWKVMVAPGGSNAAYTIYVYSRDGMKDETWVSDTADPLPIPRACTIDPVNTSVTTRAQFITWCCQQFGAGTTLHIVDQSSTYTNSTQTCPGGG